MADASVLAARAPGRTLGGMVPRPALLTPGRATDLVRADGRPQPAFRERLRSDPVVAQRVVGGIGVGAGGRSSSASRCGGATRPATWSRSCSWAARRRSSRRSCTRRPTGCCSPTAAPTTSSVAGSSATRRSRRPTRTAACTWRTTARSSAPTNPTSRSMPAIRSAARASGASSCATRPDRPGSG